MFHRWNAARTTCTGAARTTSTANSAATTGAAAAARPASGTGVTFDLQRVGRCTEPADVDEHGRGIRWHCKHAFLGGIVVIGAAVVVGQRGPRTEPDIEVCVAGTRQSHAKP